MIKEQKFGFIAIAIWIVLASIIFQSINNGCGSEGLCSIGLIVVGIALIIPVWLIGVAIGRSIDKKRKK